MPSSFSFESAVDGRGEDRGWGYARERRMEKEGRENRREGVVCVCGVCV